MTDIHPAARAARFGIAAIAATLLACGPAEETANEPAEAAFTLPDVALKTLDGEEVKLASLAGEKPLLVWFWAPW